MFYFLFICLSLLGSLSFGETGVYEALINGNITALVRFQFVNSIDTESQDETVIGTLLYDTDGTNEIFLKGNTQANGRFQWQATAFERGSGDRKSLGLLQGQLNNGGLSGEGTWEKADGTERWSLKLVRIAHQVLKKRANGKASVSYPLFDDPSLKTVNEVILAKAQMDFENNSQFIDDVIQEVRKGVPPEFQDQIEKQTAYYYASTDCETELSSRTFVSLLCDQNAYTGGAHGYNTISGRTYLIDTHDRSLIFPVKIWNILKKNEIVLKTLSKELVNLLKLQNASSIVEADENAVINEFINRLEKNQIDFTVVPAGLAFHFSPYDVASYAEGSFRVVISNKILAPLFREDGILSDRIHR